MSGATRLQLSDSKKVYTVLIIQWNTEPVEKQSAYVWGKTLWGCDWNVQVEGLTLRMLSEVGGYKL